MDDINRGDWDYVELHKVVGGVDVGLPSPYHMVVARDGGVGLPALPHLRDSQAAVEFFNRCFAALLLGGVYCEAVGSDTLEAGSIIDWTYLRSHPLSQCDANRFHHLIRLKMAPPLEACRLVAPRSIKMSSIERAMHAGQLVLNAVPELRPEFLLKGATGLARRDWGAALSNLWIVVEQITACLWEKKVLAPARASKTGAGRVDQLSDSRTWTIAARHELLYQTGTITGDVLVTLSAARKARNSLAHSGRHPTESDARSAYSSTIALLELAAPNEGLLLRHLDLADHTVSDPFLPHKRTRMKPTHWMPIPKLPGEAELERLEALAKRGPSSD